VYTDVHCCNVVIVMYNVYHACHTSVHLSWAFQQRSYNKSTSTLVVYTLRVGANPRQRCNVKDLSIYNRPKHPHIRSPVSVTSRPCVHM